MLPRSSKLKRLRNYIMECPHGHVLVSNDLTLPTEQVLFIGNYCTMFAHNDEIYIIKSARCT